MSAHPAASPGLTEAARELLASIVGHLRLRLELLGLELTQEKERVLGVVVLGLFGYLFVCGTIVLIALAVIAHYWDTPARMAAIGWTVAVFALAAVASFVLLVQKLRQPSTLFQGSLEELRQDEDRLSLTGLARSSDV